MSKEGKRKNLAKENMVCHGQSSQTSEERKKSLPGKKKAARRDLVNGARSS